MTNRRRIRTPSVRKEGSAVGRTGEAFSRGRTSVEIGRTPAIRHRMAHRGNVHKGPDRSIAKGGFHGKEAIKPQGNTPKRQGLAFPVLVTTILL